MSYINLNRPAVCKQCGAKLPVGTRARWYRNGDVYGAECHSTNRANRAKAKPARKAKRQPKTAAPRATKPQTKPPASHPGLTAFALPPEGIDVELDRKGLLDALARVKPTMGKTTIPVLAHVLIRAAGESVYVSATDLETWSTAATRAVDVRTSGGVLLHPVPLQKALKAISEPYVALSYDPADQDAVLTAGNVRIKQRAFPLEDWPNIVRHESTWKATFEGPGFHAMLKRVLPCVSREESRFQLSGFLLDQIEGEKHAHFTATDGHRLIDDVSLPPGPGPAHVILPLHPFVALPSKRCDVTADVYVELGEDTMTGLLYTRDYATRFRLQEGTFPDYRRVLHHDTTGYRAELDTTEVIAAVTPLLPLLSDRSRCVKTTWNGSLVLEVSNPDLGSADATCAVINPRGDEFTTGLNPDYLLDFLRASPETVTVSFDEKPTTSAALWSTPEWRGALMPVRLGDDHEAHVHT